MLVQKISSRKFLAALGSVLIALGTVLSGHTDPMSLGATAIAVGALISYMFAEGSVDAARLSASGTAAAAAAAATAPASAAQATSAAIDTSKGTQ